MTWFIGQKRIRQELNFLITAAGLGENYNVLFNAPSGMGKTTLGFVLAVKLIGDDFNYQPVPSPDGSVVITNHRVQFLDEIHLLKPPENIYGDMDSGDKFFIFATNRIADLPEAFMNRCLEFQFDPYTDSEIILIYQKSLKFELADEFYGELVKLSRVPREIHTICRRLNYILKGHETFSDFQNILHSVMGYTNSLSPHELAYIEALKAMDGKAGLRTISALLTLPEEYITRVVEPGLLLKKKIQITRGGRKLNE
jgi:Holliday junction resolvasome RuvABC ATP-dependent DNA helicase subunit